MQHNLARMGAESAPGPCGSPVNKKDVGLAPSHRQMHQNNIGSRTDATSAITRLCFPVNRGNRFD
jgi:hypothetical protein